MKWLPEDDGKTLQEPCVTVTPEERGSSTEKMFEKLSKNVFQTI